MRKIQSALISVYHKKGLDRILKLLDEMDIVIYSTGGTFRYIEEQGINAEKVENLTTYPSILEGRVKTLHPKVFGGILARRVSDHLEELSQFNIPQIDLVIVDLYPFEETVAQTEDERQIIEKIDIGGISLIRAAAKNYQDVLVIPSQKYYSYLERKLTDQQGMTSLEDRKEMAIAAFSESARYDSAIFNYLNQTHSNPGLHLAFQNAQALRYGENPHQKGNFYGDLEALFSKLNGKELSYNNLVDVDGAIQLMKEFKNDDPSFAIFKHTNSCGVAVRSNILEAWKAALAGDPISAFGGILISNRTIDQETAEAIDKIFYEVLIAPGFEASALEHLRKKKKRILLELKSWPDITVQHKTLLNGLISQDIDLQTENATHLTPVTDKKPSETEISDLIFANKCVKHLKSNTIVLAKNHQLIGMGCGQTSRVDAANQAIQKAERLGFELEGAVMASDAFFPFPDCVELAHKAGIHAVIQPGGSIKDQLSIDFCNEHGMAMVFTGTRHFKH